MREVATNVGRSLQRAMGVIGKAHPNQLFGIFVGAQRSDKDRLSDAMLRDLIERFSSLALTIDNLPEDEFGQGYKYLFKKLANDSVHTAADLYTNRMVVHLMTVVLDPRQVRPPAIPPAAPAACWSPSSSCRSAAASAGS